MCGSSGAYTHGRHGGLLWERVGRGDSLHLGGMDNMTTSFDRTTSLAIDAIHYELDYLTYARGIRATLRRIWLRYQLRKLERSVPR